MLTFVCNQFCCFTQSPNLDKFPSCEQTTFMEGCKISRGLFFHFIGRGFYCSKSYRGFYWTNHICPPKECHNVISGKRLHHSPLWSVINNFLNTPLSFSLSSKLGPYFRLHKCVCGCLLFLFIMKRPTTEVTFTNPWLSKHVLCGLQSVECL